MDTSKTDFIIKIKRSDTIIEEWHCEQPQNCGSMNRITDAARVTKQELEMRCIPKFQEQIIQKKSPKYKFKFKNINFVFERKKNALHKVI